MLDMWGVEEVMKHYDNIHCREPGDGNAYVRPLEEEPKQSSTCEVYRMNPDGTKGEHIKTMPGFPEGWDNPTKILPQKPKKEEEIEMTRTARTRKPSSEEMEQNWEKCGKTINAFANQYDIGWATARAWLTEAGLLEPKTTAEPEPKKDYFGTPIVGEEPKEPEAEPDLVSEEIAKLKLDFANLTLASALGDVAKLKVIEYIVRM